nr:MAG TPA_asm: hypothetical protein [Caudoviricetes sp.]
MAINRRQTILTELTKNHIIDCFGFSSTITTALTEHHLGIILGAYLTSNATTSS